MKLNRFMLIFRSRRSLRATWTLKVCNWKESGMQTVQREKISVTLSSSPILWGRKLSDILPVFFRLFWASNSGCFHQAVFCIDFAWETHDMSPSSSIDQDLCSWRRTRLWEVSLLCLNWVQKAISIWPVINAVYRMQITNEGVERF